MLKYKTVYRNSKSEIIEKKSRFIVNVRLVETEEDAIQFIKEMRKRYKNAHHHCFAYMIGEQREIIRASDDGEPAGTAGRPMLDVLLREDLYNTAVVVSRYFGGILLGTGGLVRAYSKAVREALNNTVLIEKKIGSLMEIRTNYISARRIQPLLRQRKISVLQVDYTDIVTLLVIIPIWKEKQFYQDVSNATNGQAEIKKKETLLCEADIEEEIKE